MLYADIFIHQTIFASKIKDPKDLQIDTAKVIYCLLHILRPPTRTLNSHSYAFKRKNNSSFQTYIHEQDVPLSVNQINP